MTPFEDKAAALSGENSGAFLDEAVELEKFREYYATLPNVIKARTCRGSVRPTA